ncbi:MAG: hypothetical protein NC343_02940 [Muribaculum sp.]|nr:hypothetical protein [Muribaculaceae bacterium]MCM1080684.1 hypothetical protein [Muribaculum sp.]
MLQFLRYISQLIISPGNGWEDIAARADSPADIARKGFYPLCGITACSVFVKLFYGGVKLYPLPELIEQAVVTFIMFFAGNFFASFCWSVFAPRFSAKSDATEKKQNTFIIYNLSLLAIIQIIGNCFPISLSLVQFLPLFLLVVIWAGHRYVCVKPHMMFTFMIFSALTILVPPYVISYVFLILMT